MKKILLSVLILLLSVGSIQAKEDKLALEYLLTSRPTIMTHAFEGVTEGIIKKILKKETGSNFDVKLEGYTTKSLKAGIFKYLEISGKNVKVDGLNISYVHLTSMDNYNHIDYTKNPIQFLSDMTYSYELLLTDETINQALQDSDYSKVVSKVNKIAGSLFVIKKVRTKIVKDKLYIVVDYNFPILKSSKDKSFVMSSDFQVVNGKIKAKNVYVDSAYGNISLDKVANLVNYLNPLEFTLNLLDNNKHNGNIENVNIVDNKIKVDGKIYIKAKESYLVR